jgi:hypothetical protein
LAYPFELGGICNVPLSTDPDPEESGFPRIDLLPARGLLLWVVAYDERVEADPDAVPPLDGTAVRDVAGFRNGEAAAPRWDNVRMWAKSRLGDFKTCQLFAFAGTSPLAPTDILNPLLRSIALTG